MTFYSATTPTFTEEDFDRERKSLTDVERKKLHHDMYGPSHDDDDANASGENATLIQTSLTLLEEAIDALPDEMKSSYLRAKSCVPELIQDESPPLAFLRCESFDPWAAARRLVGYWALRLQFFGQDRAFLPMAPDGAMQQDYDDFAESGLIFPVDDDIHGRVVVFWDRMNAAKVSRAVALRSCMYVTTKLCSRQNFSSKGFVLLVNYQLCDLRKHYDRALTKQLSALVDVMGAKMKAFHLCTGPGRSVAGLLLPVLKTIAGPYIRLRVIVHAGSKSDVLPHFKDYGLTETHIQAMYGLLPERLASAQSWILRQRNSERNE